MLEGKWRHRAAVLFCGVALFGLTSAESCSESVESLEDTTGENDSKYRQKIKQVQLGMSKSEVRQIMGQPPRDKQKMESEYGTSEMWYYGSWQLSFDDGKLTAKNKY